MTATTDFLPFAIGTGANVESQASYVADAIVASGFSAGVAPSAKLNKVWRQSSFVSAAIANFMATQLGTNIADDGNLSEFITNFENALTTFNGTAFATPAQVIAAIDATPALTVSAPNWKIVYPSGLIEMGGVVSAALTTESTASLTFPFGGFPTSCIDFSANVINSSSSATGDTQVQLTGMPSKTTAGLYFQDQSGTFSDAAGGYIWRAKGN